MLDGVVAFVRMPEARQGRPIWPAAQGARLEVGTGNCQRLDLGSQGRLLRTEDPGLFGGGKQLGPRSARPRATRGRWPRAFREGPNNEEAPPHRGARREFVSAPDLVGGAGA